jgi:hypothetical protein
MNATEHQPLTKQGNGAAERQSTGNQPDSIEMLV